MPILPDISFTKYLEIPRYSKSSLKALDRCPLSIATPSESSPAQVIGSYSHMMLFEGLRMCQAHYAIAPKCDKRTKEGKADYENFAAKSAGRVVISESDHDLACNITSAVHKHPEAKELLKKGTAELTVTWDDLNLGFKGRLDWLTPDGWIVDLKTTMDATERGFTREILKYSYHIQAAMYLHGMAMNDQKCKGFKFIAVEKTAPYLVGVYDLDADFLKAGHDEYIRLAKKAAAYEKMYDKRANYPNYNHGGCVTLTAPNYLKGDE